MRVATISLKRTQERWTAFLLRNKKALKRCEQLRIEGVDGITLLESGISTRLINPSALQNWSAGAIGIGLSHLLCWRICCESRSPLVVLEDDVLLAENWDLELESLLDKEAGLVLLGWNLDSMLRTEFINQQEIISLFEPPYPTENALREILKSGETRQRKRLRHTFGLPGYWLHPDTAQKLLKRIKNLETLPLRLGRGFPELSTQGIDGLLNLHYQQLKAEVVVPPLALALNNQSTSLTRISPKQYGV